MPIIWIKTNICINRTKACNLTSCKYGFLPLKTGGNVAWFGFQESWMEVVQEPQTIWWERNEIEANIEPHEPKRRTGNFECDKVNESTGHGCMVTLAATNDYFHYALLRQLGPGIKPQYFEPTILPRSYWISKNVFQYQISIPKEFISSASLGQWACGMLVLQR